METLTHDCAICKEAIVYDEGTINDSAPIIIDFGIIKSVEVDMECRAKFHQSPVCIKCRRVLYQGVVKLFASLRR